MEETIPEILLKAIEEIRNEHGVAIKDITVEWERSRVIAEQFNHHCVKDINFTAEASRR